MKRKPSMPPKQRPANPRAESQRPAGRQAPSLAVGPQGRRNAGPVAPDAKLKRRAGRIYRQLEKLYPQATCTLTHRDPFELLVATILSAQCTDKRVNVVTPNLFRKYPTAEKMARAQSAALEKLIQTTGFFRNKTKSLKAASQIIVAEHDGAVPDTMAQLLTLPGVARKTANVVLGNAFGKNEGVVVDTHVNRLSQRLGLTVHKDAPKIERDLMALFPRRTWAQLAHLLIYHGRAICTARNPACDTCSLATDCPYPHT